MLHITPHPSPNFNDRRHNAKPEYIILHYTDTLTTKEALDLLCAPKHEASAHYVIERDGHILQLVDDDKRAWHAGQSYWRGITDMNSQSIGIEIVNAGHRNQIDGEPLEPYPDAQITAVIALCKAIIDRRAILPENILAHSDIAPARKKDPGEHFPWTTLKAEGLGFWPENLDNILTLPEKKKYTAILDLGYDPKIPENIIFEAFSRHFALA
jgi:N-acetylmuramoyl-L-alanine amidase